MKKNEKIYAELFKVWTMIIKRISGEHKLEAVCRYISHLIESKKPFDCLEFREFKSTETPECGWNRDWENFYNEVFGMDIDFVNIRIPQGRFGFDWVVFVAKGLTADTVYRVIVDKFNSKPIREDNNSRSKYNLSYEKEFSINERTAKNGSYSIRVRNQICPDDELGGIKWNEIIECGYKGITLLERMLLELWFWWRTGGAHLDTNRQTACIGTHNSISYYCESFRMKAPIFYSCPDDYGSVVREGECGYFCGVRQVLTLEE